ncbi:hypothetical protein V1523DRAFT_437155 [Lipomyces doorenjongii]
MSCGSASNYTCPDQLCCSVHGWCGSSENYCLDGCQPDFGNCGSKWMPTPGASTGGPLPTSIDGQCGPGVGICPSGQCCSPSGWCGITTAYCASPDCQTGYGTCDADATPRGLNTSAIRRYKLGKVPYGEAIYGCKDPGHVAMTFDDGPYLYTDDLLNILAEHGAKATFFVTGNNLGKGEIDSLDKPWRQYITKAYAAGHQIASHSWSHANFDELTPWEQKRDLYKNEMALVNIIGKFPAYFRPPYSACGDICLATLEQLGYHVIYFDFDTEDYLHSTADTIQQSKDIVKAYFGGRDSKLSDTLSIQHDIHYQTVYNLTEYSLQIMQQKGYKLVTVGECLGDPKSNWYRSWPDKPKARSKVK